MAKRGTSRSKTPLKKKKEAAIVAAPKEETYLHVPGEVYTPAIKNSAKLLYISGKYTLKGVSTKLNISYGTLRNWHSKDNWKRARNQVVRFANKEIVRSSRKAMGVYVKNIDDMINKLETKLQLRLKTSTEELEDEEKILKLNVEVIKLKIALMRAMAAGQGQAFIPSPGSVEFEGTAPKIAPVSGLISGSNDALDEAMQSIPDYMKKAAEFVIGLTLDEEEEISSGVPEAVVINLQGDITLDGEEELEEIVMGEDDEDDFLID